MNNRLTPLIVADIGNTKIKVAQWDPASDASELNIQTFTPSKAFQTELPQQAATWILCSVSPTALERLQTWIARERPTDTIHVLSFRDVNLQVDVDFPEQVGLDRLMAAYAASCLGHETGSNDVVIIDAGTAVTIDAVSKQRFLGGTIFPGTRVAFESLNFGAEQLPMIDAHTLPESAIGKSTAQAIQAGVLFAQVGAIVHIANLVAEPLNNPSFFMTGGGITPIQSALPRHWQWVPELVVDGIRRVALENDFS